MIVEKVVNNNRIGVRWGWEGEKGPAFGMNIQSQCYPSPKQVNFFPKFLLHMQVMLHMGALDLSVA